MDLFAAIRAYLAYHNSRMRPRHVAKVWAEALRPLARCRVCEAEIVAEGDVPVLGTLLRARRCLACYLLHEAV